MRHTVLVLVVALATGSSEARAELITYNMTGTITDTSATVETWPPNRSQYHLRHLSHPYAAGDHISWTLQYNSSTPVANFTGGLNYAAGVTITNIVDHTTGYHFPIISNIDTNSKLTLSSYAQPGNYPHFTFTADQNGSNGPAFGNGSSTQRVLLQLSTASYVKPVGLQNLRLNNIPFALGPSINHKGVVSDLFWVTQEHSYGRSIDSWYVSNFNANVDSISGTGPMVASVPEPGSLTLFLLGAGGVAARAIRRRLHQVG